jgi:hypothetical protein
MTIGHYNISGKVDEAFIFVFLSRGFCVVSAPEQFYPELAFFSPPFCWRILQKTRKSIK